MYNIAVVGAGVIGLTSALAIQKKLDQKAQITIFTEKLSPETTGDVAAGLWTPYILKDTPENKSLEWAQATQDYILKLWKEGHAKEAGISLQSVLILSRKNFQVPSWIQLALGYVQLSQEKIKEYSTKFGATFTGGINHMAFTWEASTFLPFLQQKFEANNGRVFVKKIQSFEELSNFDVIVNCTGVNAKILANDEMVRPIRGQVTRIQAPWQFQTIRIDDDNYIIPNCDCVILGGTKQEDDDNTTVYKKDIEFILSGCQKLVPNLKNARIIQHQVGLRPGRNSVRLEIEIKDELKIVHNYGHGGSGITLCIGCGLECAKLVEAVLGLSNKL